MRSQLTAFPSLSRTLAKRSETKLKPNFAKEPSRSVRSDARTERQCGQNDKKNKQRNANKVYMP